MKLVKKVVCLMVFSMLLIPIVTFAEVPQDTVKRVQSILNERGYDCGTPDGIVGSHTAEAVANYQTDNGLEPSGDINEELLGSLGISNEQDTSGVPGIPVEVFLSRYNSAISTYNQIAERDGYTKALTIPSLATDTEDVVLDDTAKAKLTVNGGKANSIGMICSFNFSYPFEPSTFDSPLLTGEIISCMYAFDESLSDYTAAGNLYSKLMESNNVSEYNDEEIYIDNGEIHYSNIQSLTGFYVYAYYNNYVAAIKPYQDPDAESDTKDGIVIDEDINQLVRAIGSSRIDYEAIAGVSFSDYPREEITRKFVYSIEGSIYDHPCIYKFTVLPSDSTITDITINFNDNLTDSADQIINDFTKDLKVEGTEKDGFTEEWIIDNIKLVFNFPDGRPSAIIITDEESASSGTEQSKESEKVITITSLEDADSFSQLVNKDKTVFEEYGGLSLKDYPSEVYKDTKIENTLIYTIENCSFMNYSCSIRPWVSPTGRVNGIKIVFDEKIAEPDRDYLVEQISVFTRDDPSYKDGVISWWFNCDIDMMWSSQATEILFRPA